MKKLIRIGALLLMVSLVITGCSAPEPAEVEPDPTEVVTASPTFFIPTPEPTFTPRPMDGVVEEPEPDATLIMIEPIDKPTRPPIVFEYEEYVSNKLGVKFSAPTYWQWPQEDDSTISLTFQEPATDIRSGEAIPANVFITVSTLPTTQTTKDSSDALDQWIADMRAEHPSLETSSKAENSMMSEKGTYVTYWIRVQKPNAEEGDTLKMRGRCLIVPKDKRLYMISYLCPADFNTEYEKVFKKIRDTIVEL